MSNTKVRVLAFQMDTSTGVSIGDFYQSLEKMDGDENIKAHGRNHLIRTRIVNGYISVVLLKISSDKKSVISRKSTDGKHEVVTNILRDTESGVEVVLLLLNPQTGRGLMYNYWKSTSPAMLIKIFGKANTQARRWVAKPYREELKDKFKDRGRVLKELTKKFPNNFSLSIIQEEYSINDIIQNLKDIRSIVVSGEELSMGQGTISPFVDIMPAKRVEYRARAKESFSAVSNAARQIASYFMGVPGSAKIALSGLNFEGELTHFKVGSNIHSLDELDFDDYVDLLPNDYWENFWKSSACRRLLRLAENYSAIIGKPPNVSSWRKGMKHPAENLRV